MDIHIVCLACRRGDCAHCKVHHALHKCEETWNYFCSCECVTERQLTLPYEMKNSAKTGFA